MKHQLRMEEHVYLAHIIESVNIKPDPVKTEAIRQFSIPQSKKQVKAFLGLAGY